MLREHSQRSPGKVTVLLRSKTRPGCPSTGPELRTLNVPLDGGSCLIGRASKNANKNLLPQHANALFECAVMSRYHASIKIPDGVDGPVLIQDTKSMHGVYVNGKQVQSIEIVVGDTIKFGASVSRLDTVHDGVEVQVQDIIRKPAVTRKVIAISSEETSSVANPTEHAPHSGQSQTQSQTQGASMKCPVFIDIDDEVDHEDKKAHQDRDTHPRRPSPSSPFRDENNEDDQSLFGCDSNDAEEDYEYGSASDEEAEADSQRSMSPASDDEDIDDDDESKADDAEETLSPEQPASPSKPAGKANTAPSQPAFSASGFPWDNADHNTIAKAHAGNQLPSIDHMTSGMDVSGRPSPQFPPRTFSELMRPSFKLYDNAPDRFGSVTQGPWNDRSSTTQPTYSNNGIQPSIPNLLGSSNNNHHDWDSHHREDATDMFDECFMPFMSHGGSNELCDRAPADKKSTADASSITIPSLSTALPPPINPSNLSTMTFPPASDPVPAAVPEAPTTEGQDESSDKEDSVMAEDTAQKGVLEGLLAAVSDKSAPMPVSEDATTTTGKRKRDTEDDGSVEVTEQGEQAAIQTDSGKVTVQTSRPIKVARRNKRAKTALSAVGVAVGGMAVLFGALMTPLSEQLLVDWDWPQS